LLNELKIRFSFWHNCFPDSLFILGYNNSTDHDPPVIYLMRSR